jgi:hypothetical protein
MWGVGVGEGWQLPAGIEPPVKWTFWVHEVDYEPGGYQGRVIVEAAGPKTALEKLPRQAALQLTPDVDEWEVWKMAPYDELEDNDA